MSRARRPLRRVRAPERDRLARALGVDLGDVAWWPIERTARRLRCRASHLRRCLLGRHVSAHAAGRILAMTSAA